MRGAWAARGPHAGHASRRAHRPCALAGCAHRPCALAGRAHRPCALAGRASRGPGPAYLLPGSNTPAVRLVFRLLPG